MDDAFTFTFTYDFCIYDSHSTTCAIHRRPGVPLLSSVIVTIRVVMQSLPPYPTEIFLLTLVLGVQMATLLFCVTKTRDEILVTPPRVLILLNSPTTFA